jgi:hypothetical protein
VNTDLPQKLRENLALSMARALRDSLEGQHAGTAWKRSGLTDPVIAFVNRRAARFCYKKLGDLSYADFLSIYDWQPWIDGMWSYAVAETDLHDRVRIAKTPWRNACRFARNRLRMVKVLLEQSIKDGVPFGQYARLILPAGWDSPAAPVPDRLET